ncbi:hypothetical protein [Coconut foliar decay alphasatellite 5]|uniref:Uncharacterized protein n=1 Tax=Coconut foliar decay alphasatellite 5 TaxID=2161878 RepID=A0A2R4N9B5_9VIRU|nr:hypothetical protein KM709_gp4 [Coconut foliar decay alphasatellite 5]AVX29432.1 hypothetical protein [Coconut foliar decay alphasatellite 5]
MTRYTLKGLKAPTCRTEITVRKNRYDSSTESRLELDVNGDCSSDLQRTLTTCFLKTLEDIEDASLTDMRWNGESGPLHVTSHIHCMIGSMKSSLPLKNHRMTEPSSGSVEDPVEKASPCSASFSG